MDLNGQLHYSTNAGGFEMERGCGRDVDMLFIWLRYCNFPFAVLCL